MCTMWLRINRQSPASCCETLWFANPGARHQVSEKKTPQIIIIILSGHAYQLRNNTPICDPSSLFFSQVSMERHAATRESPFEGVCHAAIVKRK